MHAVQRVTHDYNVMIGWTRVRVCAYECTYICLNSSVICFFIAPDPGLWIRVLWMHQAIFGGKSWHLPLPWSAITGFLFVGLARARRKCGWRIDSLWPGVWSWETVRKGLVFSQALSHEPGGGGSCGSLGGCPKSPY